jgi:AcrR family transcriptional regulator
VTRPDERRAWILAAAIHLVARTGYRRTTLAAIMSEAGVSRETFKVDFSGKQDCFLAACDDAIAGLLDSAEEAGAHERDWSARVGAALRLLLERLAKNPDIAQACVVELPRAGMAALASEDRTLDRLAKVLKPPTDPSGEPQPVTLVDELLAGGVWEMIRATLVRGSPADLPSLLPQLQEWVVHRQRPGRRRTGDDERTPGP